MRKNILGIKPVWDIPVLVGLVAVLFLVGACVNNQIVKEMTVKASEDLELMKNASSQTQELNMELSEKELRIKELNDRFEELMNNPITFKQTYFLEKQLFPLSRKYGIPDALIAGQWAIESGRAVNKPGHNYFGLMQWDAQRNRSLQHCPSLDHCVKNYAATIKSILKRKGYEYNPNENPVEILKKLQEATPRYEGDNPDTMHYVDLVSETKEFKTYAN